MAKILNMKKIFQDMTWKKVIIFSIVTAVYTATVNIIPLFKGTSIQDIAVYLDLWIVFALVIILNCKTYKEAAAKCFVFFLISQPLIFLIEALFTSEGFAVFRHYPHWLRITFLTIPGAIIAYQIKKKNWLSVFAITVANIELSYQIMFYLRMTINHFPNHILSIIICICEILYFTFKLLDKKLHRFITIIFVLATLIFSAITLETFKTKSTYDLYLDDSNWSYEITNDEIVSIEMIDNKVTLTTKKPGTASLFFTNDNNVRIEYYVEVSGPNIFVSLID